MKVGSYLDSWEKLIESVRGGMSWSGSERNCCFLNSKGKTFQNASHLSGLDMDDDGRAFAVCDWDRDGDQDLWMRNRSAPRLRLMLNDTQVHRSVSLRLEGDQCNRDAVGAIVKMKTTSGLMMRSLRAGELFLSQSSKWLHFGLGEKDQVRNVSVAWPGGEEETFSGIHDDGRFLLRQGKGNAVRVSLPSKIEIEERSAPITKRRSLSPNVCLPVEVPLPRVSFRDPGAKMQAFPDKARPVLLTLWESSSEICVSELTRLEENRARLVSEGVELLALSINGIDTAGSAYDVVSDCGFAGSWGFIEPNSLAFLKRWQELLFERRPEMKVPCSFLINGQGNCVAIYRSGVSDKMIKDMARLVGMDPMTRWHYSPLLRGTWFTNPLDGKYVRAFVKSRM